MSDYRAVKRVRVLAPGSNTIVAGYTYDCTDSELREHLETVRREITDAKGREEAAIIRARLGSGPASDAQGPREELIGLGHWQARFEGEIARRRDEAEREARRERERQRLAEIEGGAGDEAWQLTRGGVATRWGRP